MKDLVRFKVVCSYKNTMDPIIKGVHAKMHSYIFVFIIFRLVWCSGAEIWWKQKSETVHFCVDTLYDVIFFAKSTQYLIFINFLSSKMKILKILLSGFAQSSVTVLPCIGYLLLFPNFLVTDSLSYLHMRFVSGLLTLQNWRGVGPPLPPTLFVLGL